MKIVADASVVAKWVLVDSDREEPDADSAVETALQSRGFGCWPSSGSSPVGKA